MAATQIPLTFRLAPLPTGFRGTPQQLATAIVARLSAVSANAISFFASGSVAPTSNVGPWLKNDQTWYVWSDTLATYIPEIIDPSALGYTFSQSAPDQNQFKIWFKLNGSNDPDGILIYANGAWKDTYDIRFASYSTTTQMNTAISAAVGSQTRYPFSAIKAFNQTFTANDPGVVVEFPTAQYDPSSVYNGGTSTFTAPVSGIYTFKAGILISQSSGAQQETLITLQLAVNGGSVFAFVENEDQSATGPTNGRTMDISRDVFLSAGNTVNVMVGITAAGAATWDTDTNSAANFFQGSLIQAQ